MSPQFVDYDADGELDIVCGIFDGSPHLVRGTAKGWGAPEQILDANGDRIVLNAFWNFDTKKWDSTNAHDDPRRRPEHEGHATSAIVHDLDGDGDLDLLLGDHRSGRVYRRINEGTRQEPRFSTVNELVFAGGQPIDVPGTVATLRLVDWNGDGRLDLACGGMGDAYGDGPGGGVQVHLDVGKTKAVEYGPAIVLLQQGRKDAKQPTRPDSGLYVDFADHDGDGDLDMVAGGYSYWTPEPVELTDEQKVRRDELKRLVKEASGTMQALLKAIDAAVEGLGEEAAQKKREALLDDRKAEFEAASKRRAELQQELEPFEPGLKRRSWVWLYENLQR